MICWGLCSGLFRDFCGCLGCKDIYRLETVFAEGTVTCLVTGVDVFIV